MRKLALMLAQCLLLAGCTGLPQPREMGRWPFFVPWEWMPPNGA